MSFYEEKKGNSVQEYVQIGRNRRFYLRNKNDPSNVNVKNVLDALDALKAKSMDPFYEKERYLVSMLPAKERDQYISKRIEDLDKIRDKLVSSLSTAAKKHRAKD